MFHTCPSSFDRLIPQAHSNLWIRSKYVSSQISPHKNNSCSHPGRIMSLMVAAQASRCSNTYTSFSTAIYEAYLYLQCKIIYMKISHLMPGWVHSMFTYIRHVYKTMTSLYHKQWKAAWVHGGLKMSGQVSWNRERHVLAYTACCAFITLPIPHSSGHVT